MLKDNYLFSNDFDKIVNETYQLSPENFKLQAIESSISVIKLILAENHCYVVNYNKKSIEIPKNWGVFATMRSGEFKRLSDLDRDFNSIFLDYFDLAGEVFLGLNDEGLYFLFKENKDEKKAA